VYEPSRLWRQQVQVRVLDKFVSPTRRARRGQVVRPKLDWEHLEVYPLHYKAQRKSFEKLLAISASGHHVWSIAGKGLAAARLRDTLRSRLTSEYARGSDPSLGDSATLGAALAAPVRPPRRRATAPERQ